MSKKEIIMNYILFGVLFIGSISVIVFSSFALICSLALFIYFDEIRFHFLAVGILVIMFLYYSIRFFIEEIEDYKEFKKKRNEYLKP